MISITQQNGHISYGTKDFVIDTVDDLGDLPVDVAPGSTAFCIDTSAVYMLNNNSEWKEI